MSKRVTTTGYIVSWMIGALALAVFLRTAESITTPDAAASGLPASFVFGIASLVMFVLWIGALAAVAQHRAWGWFVAVLVLQVIGLGIIGMAAYAIAGPPERPVPSVTRPSVT